MSQINSPAVDLMQTAIIDALKKMFGKTVRSVEILGGAWNNKTQERITNVFPAIYLSWMGDASTQNPNERLHTWVFFVVAETLNGVRANDIQAHHIIERIEYQFDHRRLSNQNGPIGGHLYHKRTDNVWNDERTVGGISLFAITFNQAMIIRDPVSTLDDDEFLSMFEKYVDENETVLLEGQIWPRNPDGLP